MTLDLFSDSNSDKELTLKNASFINGLEIYFDFVSEQEEHELLNNIDNNTWLLDLKRRVQHYGFKYDYRSRKIDKTYYIGEIPSWMNFLSKRLIEKGIINFVPDQAIINEYIDDQGIAPHIDCEPCFGDVIISLSLNSQCVMNFEKQPNAKQKQPLLLASKTLVVMKGESRYNWYHGIPTRKTDEFNFSKHKRGRRVSITFRKVIL